MIPCGSMYPMIITSNYCSSEIQIWKKNINGPYYCSHVLSNPKMRIYEILCKNSMIYSHSGDGITRIWNYEGVQLFNISIFPRFPYKGKCGNIMVLDNGDIFESTVTNRMKANTLHGEMTYDKKSCKMYYQVEKYIKNLNLNSNSLPINVQGYQIGLKQENSSFEIIGSLPDDRIIINCCNYSIKFINLASVPYIIDANNANDLLMNVDADIEECIDIKDYENSNMTKFVCIKDKIISLNEGESGLSIFVWK
jgi:hypothetical protein